MIKKVTILFTLVVGLILPVTYVASGSTIGASQPLPELPDRSAAFSGLSGPYRNMMAAELKTCAVDFNYDGVVDVGDIMRVANCWRSTDPTDIAPYDLNNDGKINVVDIMLVVVQWGNHCPVLFAVDMGGQDTDPTRRDLAAAAGFRLHRTSVSWASVEPDNVDLTNPANGNWPDSTFNVYRNDRRLIPYVMVLNNPSWAASKACGPIYPAHLGDFGEFVGQLVSRYADVTPFWVFYNEEDQWTTYTGDDAGGCWGGHGAEYAQMLAVAWDAAHDANPDAQVIFGAVAYEPEWHPDVWDPFFFRDAFEHMQNHSDDDYVDIIAANQYNFLRNDWDGWSGTLPENQEIIAKFRHAVSDTSFYTDTARAYSIDKWQSAYGLDKPLASGEVGEQVSQGCGGDVQKCEELHARQAVHVNVRGMAAGLKIICWYTLVDKPGGLKYGLLRSETDPRPSYTAYQVLTGELEGYSFEDQLVVTSGTVNPEYVQAYRFDKGGNKKLVLWRDSGEKLKDQSTTATETMTVSAAELGTWTGQVLVTNKLGEDVTDEATVSSGPSSVTLEFSSDPIYVEAY